MIDDQKALLRRNFLGGVLANLVWARLVDRHGSRPMLTVCATLSTITPLSAIFLPRLGWGGMLPVVFLGGATANGRKVGFSSALLELAPAIERPTYSALNAVMILPAAFLPLAAGFLLRYVSYSNLFLIAATFIGAGTLLTLRLPDRLSR